MKTGLLHVGMDTSQDKHDASTVKQATVQRHQTVTVTSDLSHQDMSDADRQREALTESYRTCNQSINPSHSSKQHAEWKLVDTRQFAGLVK